MPKSFNPKFGLVSLMIVLAAMSRLLPHPPNFTAIGALCLLGAAYYSKNWWAILVPILAFWVSDLVLNNVIYAEFFEGFSFVSIHFMWSAIAIVAMVAFGRVIMKKVNVKSVFGGAIGVSLIFFLISNLGIWISGAMYPLTAAGLMACYTAGLPFLLNSVAGNLFFGAVLFGSYSFFQSKVPALQQAH